jgi:phosphohistidine phosphatase
MKELFLIRHAKSDWDKMDVKDIDRPLKGRGVRDALMVGEYMGKHFEHPAMMLTSPACRAFHTAVLFCRAMEDPCEIIHVRESLYLASYNEMLAVVREASPSLHALAIVAHNPGITDLANFFLQESIHNIPTSGFVYMAFESDTWEEARSERMVKHAFHYPKELLME